MLRKVLSISIAFALLLLASFATLAQAPAKKMTKDDVFRGIAAQVIKQSESPATSIIGALDEVIEVGEITISPTDGKATAIIKERNEFKTQSVNKEIPLLFSPLPDNTWKWEEFKNDTKMYPIDKLFPYAKNDLTMRRTAVDNAWKKYLASITAQGEAAFKLLDTAKVVIKKDPEPLAAVVTVRESLKKAVGGDDMYTLKAALKELEQAVDPIKTLTDNYPDLKANDAYLRLNDALEAARKQLTASHNEYLNSIKQYNERIQRLPFTLVAYGFGFTKMEPKIEAEQ